MKKGLIALACLALTSIMPTYATDWQEKTDTIWPARHYRELNGLATGDQRSKSSISWSYTEGSVLVYGIHFPTGHVRADAVFKGIGGKRVTFGVRIVHPATGTVVLETSSTSTKTTSAQQTMEIMPDTEMPYDGWYRFELTCPNGSSTLSQLDLLLFQRTSTLKITDSDIFMAPSVHLWWSTKVPGAPSGQAYNWSYLEVMYPSEYRQPATYQMAIGTDGMYSGIQMPTHGLDDYGHSVLFSVWDNGDVDKDKNLPDIMRSAAVDLGPDAYATRFGGEGTGSSIRYRRDDFWEFDHWVQFLYNVRPDIICVTDSLGNVTEYESTLQTVWFKMAEEPDWHYMGTLRMAGANRLTSGIYSFLENFGDRGGNLMRRCYFRNGAMRSAADGKWYALNHAGYGHTQDNGARNSRYDYGHGLTSLFDKTFYLETGGYMGKRDSLDTCEPPVQGEMPWVDTINIARLEQRVDEGVLHYQTKTTQSRIELTRTVSDPATWKVIKWSDEETVGEGDNGRATMILDGNISTYYHNKWKNGEVKYPHYFDIEAPDTVTISSIGLYQSRESEYRAKKVTISKSDNGTSWKTVGSNLTIEDTDYPTIPLPQPATGKYFRLRFTSGYGTNLVINEVYFKHEYRLDDLLALAQQIIDESDTWRAYAPADLEGLMAVYADGTCTDKEALLQALEDLAHTAQPLTYGVVDKAESFTPLAVYQLHNLSGRGDVISTAEGVPTIVASNASNALEGYRQPCSVTNPYCNWMILHSDKYHEYYLYNLGAKKYLNVDGSTVILSETPIPVNIQKSGKGFSISFNGKYLGVSPSIEKPVVQVSSAGTNSIFQLRTNQYLRPDESVVYEMATEAEQALHDNISELIYQQALQTYAKAFVAQPDLSSLLIRNSTYLTSNANTTQQTEHNLAKLIDKKTDTYYETWYSGITWPQEMSYIQAHLSTVLEAFAFSFTPSQNPDYGLPDIPTDIIVSTSTAPKNFVPVIELTEGMPSSIDESYVSPVIFTDGNTRYIRFQVMQTIGQRADSHIFAMSEFQVHKAIIDEEASPYYMKSNVKEAFDALLAEIQAMRPLLVANTATAEDRESLSQAIERAELALQTADEIKLPFSDLSSREQVIYNLAGQRVNKIGKGIYIVNGKKVLK
ncbi:MAG: DUF3472 domain-containing protein [Bacteroidaceae bacterium]|nr:DUF3472 domain-containing protein [Bacteroidaceae bacterium]